MSFEFSHPEVQSAYEPSGKTTGKGLVLMAGAGIVTALLGGLALFYVGREAIDAGSLGPIALLLVAIFVFLALPFLVGWAIGAAVGHASVWGKSRSTGLATGFALVAGALAVAAATGVRALEVSDPFDSTVEFVYPAVALIVVWFSAWSSADSPIAQHPFCEQCDRYMTKEVLGRGHPRREQAWLQSAQTGHLAVLVGMSVEEIMPGHDYCELVGWYCEGCWESGLLELHSSRARLEVNNDGEEKETRETRLIFSTLLDAEQAEELFRNERAKAGAEAKKLAATAA